MIAAGLLIIATSVLAPHFAIVVGLVAFLLAHVLGGRTGTVVTALVLVTAASAPIAAQVETPYFIRTKDITLPATLALPATTTPVSVVVIIAGSGPTDRNGNGPLVQSDTYAQLAKQLAEAGIASVRYDKRGLGLSGLTIDHSQLTVDSYVTDVRTIVDTLSRDTRFSGIYLMGHSEGAMHAILAANRGAPVRGVVMLSGAGRRLAEVLHDQLRTQLDSANATAVDSGFARFTRGEDLGVMPKAAQSLFVPHYRRFLTSMAAYDPQLELRRATVPVLLVSGGTDWQVTSRDHAALSAANSGATALIIRNANHLYKAASSADPAAQQSLYHDRSVPIVPELVPGIVSWIGHRAP